MIPFLEKNSTSTLRVHVLFFFVMSPREKRKGEKEEKERDPVGAKNGTIGTGQSLFSLTAVNGLLLLSV